MFLAISDRPTDRLGSLFLWLGLKIVDKNGENSMVSMRSALSCNRQLSVPGPQATPNTVDSMQPPNNSIASMAGAGRDQKLMDASSP